MRLLPPGILSFSIAFASLIVSDANALEVRGYSEALHNRLLQFPGAPIFQQTPAINPGFTPSAVLFRGIGWPTDAQDWTRQMALISPRHFLCATHYPPELSWQLAFLGSDGNQHVYGIESRTPVLNEQGQPTDLMLCTLSAPVAANVGITPFRVMNAANENDLIGREMIVCGSFVRAGKMPLAGFTTLPGDAGFDTSRFAYYDYFTSSAVTGNCYYQGGDSGSPAFVLVDGAPALVGTASAVDRFSAGQVRGYMTFVPAYIPQLDAMMAAKGYQVRRAYPAATLLETQIVGDGMPRQRKPGSVTIFQENSGAAEARNISMRISFSSAPTSVAGDGWFCEALSPVLWDCHRAGLGSGGQTSIKPKWDSLPKADTLQVSIVKRYDGAADVTLNQSIPLKETYASWMEGVSDAGELADPDGDGISNLLEYHFGGSPEIASPLSAYGHPILPRIVASGSGILVKFPRRLDAEARGLTEHLEYSSTLEAGSWSEEAPLRTVVTSAPFSPVWDGFEEVTVSLPRSAGRWFVRVRVALAE